MVSDMFCISRSRVVEHQKILFLAEVMYFLNLAYNTITIHVCKLQIVISQNNFRNIFEKSIQARGLKLGSYVPLMSFYKLISGIFEFFLIFMAENGS